MKIHRRKTGYKELNKSKKADKSSVVALAVCLAVTAAGGTAAVNFYRNSPKNAIEKITQPADENVLLPQISNVLSGSSDDGEMDEESSSDSLTDESENAVENTDSAENPDTPTTENTADTAVSNNNRHDKNNIQKENSEHSADASDDNPTVKNPSVDKTTSDNSEADNSASDTSATDTSVGDSAENSSESADEKSDDISESSTTDSANENFERNENFVTSQTPHQIDDTVTPSGSTADIEYFSASIIDGETVKSRSYAFSVTHLRSELTLLSLTVEVNGSEIAQFQGSCTLDEGENVIRITAVYNDQSGAVVRAYKDYTVICDLGEISLKCDLSDGMTTTSPTLSFTASATLDGEKIPLTVTVGNENVSGDGSYEISLSEGENVVKITAKSGEKSLEKSYRVTYSPETVFGLVTDLYDQTVTSPDFCFTADSGLGKISATLNGEALHKSGSNYSCILKKGANTIILKGKYGSESFTNQFTVTYSPPLSEGDLPKITNINVFDGKTVKGSVYTLTLTANDSDGNRLNSQKIVVLLNGKVIRRQWENSDETGYRLNLENGENSLSITVTDSSGASRDYYYRISRQPTESGEEIGRVTVSVNAANAGISDICTAADYPFYDGETSYDILCRLLSENDFEVTASGGYIRRISKENAFASCTLSSTALDYLSAHSITASGDFKADSLGEFDVTSGSGWVYFKNGKQPNYALSEDYPTDGDSIILSFTLDYGNDLGGRS